MILEIYLPLVILSVAMVALGYTWREHSEYALVGFTFLFLLGFLLNGQLGGVDYKMGSNMTATVSYDGSGNIDGITQNVGYHYIPYVDNNRFGFWLAIVSAAGFVITLFSYNSTKKYWINRWKDEEEEYYGD